MWKQHRNIQPKLNTLTFQAYRINHGDFRYKCKTWGNLLCLELTNIEKNKQKLHLTSSPSEDTSKASAYANEQFFHSKCQNKKSYICNQEMKIWCGKTELTGPIQTEFLLGVQNEALVPPRMRQGGRSQAEKHLSKTRGFRMFSWQRYITSNA